jgi:hypothetical protein
MWLLERQVFQDNGYSFVPQIEDTMKYYKSTKMVKSDAEEKHNYSELPFDERNSQFMLRKQSNLAQIEHETTPAFTPLINTKKSATNQETGLSRLTKLHAD